MRSGRSQKAGRVAWPRPGAADRTSGRSPALLPLQAHAGHTVVAGGGLVVDMLPPLRWLER
jgi:hypothetical protein